MCVTTREGTRAAGDSVLRLSTVVMIGFAVLFGLLAVFIAQSWLNSQAEMRMKSLEAQKKTIATQTIVVASKSLRFGSELGSMSMREIAWPEGAVPNGAFKKISDVTGKGRRVVLTAIEENEPILSSKITGAGQRATLSAMIADGMRAVTIRVNDVEGVAGFVLPGDHVDVALTRQADKAAATTDVVLQNIKVLAIDQIADERADKPSVARSVTLEVDLAAGQKLALASSIGTLSLVLRKAGEVAFDASRRITLGDLLGVEPAKLEDMKYATIRVHRPSKKDDYSVPAERDGSTVGRRVAE
jgi:pilus assembly protein CpaB